MDEQELIIRIKALTDDYVKGMTKVQQTTETAEKGMKKTGGSLGGLKLGFLAVVGAITGAIAIINKLTQAFMVQEKADLMLANSLRRIGQIDAFGTLKEQAAEFQKQTVYGDEVVEGAFTRLIDLTGSAKTAMDAMPVVADLAAAKNMDLAMAADLVGRTASGNIGALGRYGISMKEVEARGGGLNAVLEVLNEKFGGSASAAAQSFSGQLAMMKNRLGDVAEKLGASLMPFVIKLMNTLVPVVEGLLPQLVPLLDMVASMLNAILPPIMELINKLLPPIMDILNTMMPFIIQIVEQLLPPLSDLLISVLVPVLQLLNPILQGLIVVLTPIIDVIAELVKGLKWLIDLIVGQVIKAFNDFKERIAAIKEWFTKLSDTFKNSEFYKKAAGFFDGLKKAAGEFWTNVKKGFEVLESKSGLLQSIHKFFDGVIAKVKEIWEWIVKVLGLIGKTPQTSGYSSPAGPINPEKVLGPQKPALSDLALPEAPTTGGEGKREYSSEGSGVSSMRGIAEGAGALANRDLEFWTNRRAMAAAQEAIPNALAEAAKALEKYEGIARDVMQGLGDVFRQGFQVILTSFFEPLKIQIDSTMSGFQKFGATIINGLVNFLSKMIQQILIQGLAVAGIITLLNLIPPGGIGTFLLRMLTGLSSEDAEKAVSGGFLNLFAGLAGGGFDVPENDLRARRWGNDLMSNLSAGFNNAKPTSVEKGQYNQGNIIVQGEFAQILKFFRSRPESEKRLWNRNQELLGEAGI
jgi:phage-related protein